MKITLKPNVRLDNLSPQCVLFITIAAGCYEMHGMNEMVVTSINDLVHGRASLHHRGDAFDLRTKSVPRDVVPLVVEAIRYAIPVEEADVVLEDYTTNGKRHDNEHIHIEYQPKR